MIHKIDSKYVNDNVYNNVWINVWIALPWNPIQNVGPPHPAVFFTLRPFKFEEKFDYVLHPPHIIFNTQGNKLHPKGNHERTNPYTQTQRHHTQNLRRKPNSWFSSPSVLWVQSREKNPILWKRFLSLSIVCGWFTSNRIFHSQFLDSRNSWYW
mgnify:CR=1 FL=1